MKVFALIFVGLALHAQTPVELATLRYIDPAVRGGTGASRATPPEANLRELKQVARRVATARGQLLRCDACEMARIECSVTPRIWPLDARNATHATSAKSCQSREPAPPPHQASGSRFTTPAA